MEKDPAIFSPRRFAWGIALGWAPLMFFIYGMASALRGISSNKATGLGAVAGGLAEAVTVFGFASAVVCWVAAIVFLSRAISRQTPARSLLSLLTIFCCGLALLGMALALYASFRHF